MTGRTEHCVDQRSRAYSLMPTMRGVLLATLPGRMAVCLLLMSGLWEACGAEAVVGSSLPGGNDDGGWRRQWPMERVAEMDGAEFMGFVSPLVDMSANAYRYPGTLRSIPGWNLSTHISPLQPSHGGAHALVFEEHPSCQQPASTQHDLDAGTSQGNFPQDKCADVAHRIVVAFRGTQLSASIDSQADACADKLLWDGFDFGTLPAECLVFDPNTLDYISQALNYTRQVIQVYPSASILLTGHSLGAGLAVLVAGALSGTYTLPVVGFGAPGTRAPLQDRGISVSSLENGSVLVVGHEWDVIMRTQMEGQVGVLCLYPQAEPPACECCIPSSAGLQPYVGTHQGSDSSSHLGRRREVDAALHAKPGHLNLDSLLLPAECTDCFYATHYLKVLIGLVNQGIKPVCQQAGRTKGSAWL